MQSVKNCISPIVSKMKKAFDITDSLHHQLSFDAADALINEIGNLDEIHSFEKFFLPHLKESPTGEHLAIKLAISKLQMKSLVPFHLTVLFAMYNEHNRLKTKSEHEAGEDFLRQKVKELQWLFNDFPQHSWDMLAIDDGCPNNSGKLSENIISANKLQNTKVIYLQEVIDSGDEDFKDILNTKDSQKGGSIHYGFKKVLTEYPKDKKHIVVYTDADLSANMGMSGLLAAPIINSGKVVSIGDRLVTGANYATNTGSLGLMDHDVAHLALRVWIRGNILPPLKGIVDTQCGFKAIDVEALSKVYGKLKDRKFSFDMEFLLKTAETFQNEDPFEIVPIVWVESAAESNFYSQEGSLEISAQSYFKMIKNMCGMNEKLFKDDPRCDAECIEYFSKIEFEEYYKIAQKLTEKSNELVIGEFETSVTKLKEYN